MTAAGIDTTEGAGNWALVPLVEEGWTDGLTKLKALMESRR